MNYYQFIRFIFFIFPVFLLHAEINFNQSQDFILESKQVVIPNHPYVFNPSIVRYNGQLLMSFREICYPTYNSFIGLIKLDENFSPVGKPQYLNENLTAVNCEDARLIVIDDRLYVIYNGCQELSSSIEGSSNGFSRMYIAELVEEENYFVVITEEFLSSFEGEVPVRREKNWVPFEYQNQLLLAYSLTPHRILIPIFGTGSCDTLDVAISEIDWEWGELRGGTPALIDKEEQCYLGFFHSSIYIKSPFSLDTIVPHYFIGAYTFADSPPFYITKVSLLPIIGDNFYGINPYQPYWHPVNVIFPCGFIMDDTHIWLTYGKHDHEMWVVKMNKAGLLKSLKPVKTFP